jgi:dCMP deaminase
MSKSDINVDIRALTIRSRVSWPEYFMDLAHHVASRSTCLRRRVGALAVRDKRILATGYNGAPRGLVHCKDVGCLRDQMRVPSGERHELCRAVHAEQNVICQAASNGVTLDGADLYCTTYPCIICTKMLINCGITRIIYDNNYSDELARRFFAEAGVETVQVRDLTIKERYQ